MLVTYTKYTSPLKLFDYLSVGKVIICSDFKVLREILKEKQNAIFVQNYSNIFFLENGNIKIISTDQIKNILLPRITICIVKLFP